MGWKSLGKDAVNKNTKPIQFIPQPTKSKNVTSAFPPDLHEELMDYCTSRRLSAAQLIRFLVARELRG